MSQTPTELDAILISRQNYRDNDLIVRLLTAERGQVSAIARSARASRRRFGGSLDYGNLLRATLTPGKGELWTLVEVTLLSSRTAARRDLERVALLGYACEAVSALAQVDRPEPQLYGLLNVAGLLLEDAPEPPRALFRLALEAKALTFAGLTPMLQRCIECLGAIDGPPGPPLHFDPQRGGALHDECDKDGGRPVSLRWLAAVEAARRTPLAQLTVGQPPAGPLWALSETIEAHSERTLRSRSVLASLHPYG
ncbi:MAG: DNA repair protein RecO (recombination protein O) [Myxococcota bacterium]|jgi:DNA repair protein RecO (recombination protein O)